MVAPLFIAGRPREGAKRVAVRAPWDQSVVDEVTLADEALIEEAVARAHAAVKPLRKWPTHERKRALSAIADGLRDDRERLATQLAREAGKPITYARAEVSRAESTFRIASEECSRLGGDVMALDASAAFEGAVGAWTRVSSGALLAITPFNFPLNLVAHKLAPAFALAMPVVLKPAPQTPLSAIALAEICARAGLPDAMLSVLCTSNEQAAKLVADERFSAVSFTGSASVGWGIKASAGKKRTTLELGGNAAAIVAPDTDPLSVLDKIITPAFAYAGQVCIKTQRVFVQRAQLERFAQAAEARTRALSASDPLEDATIAGPVIDLRSAQRILQWIEEARAQGASVRCGGTAEQTRVAPTLVTGAREGCKLVDEEVFGPVLTVHSYDAIDDAIDEVERSRYGLQCALFTQDLRVVRAAFEALTVGALVVNEATTFRVDAMPYGGVKDSGLGREGVRFAIDELSDKKLLVVR